jgi:hypothetical protein
VTRLDFLFSRPALLLKAGAHRFNLYGHLIWCSKACQQVFAERLEFCLAGGQLLGRPLRTGPSTNCVPIVCQCSANEQNGDQLRNSWIVAKYIVNNT